MRGGVTKGRRVAEADRLLDDELNSLAAELEQFDSPQLARAKQRLARLRTAVTQVIGDNGRLIRANRELRNINQNLVDLQKVADRLVGAYEEELNLLKAQNEDLRRSQQTGG